jgi:hypothetical protein
VFAGLALEFLAVERHPHAPAIHRLPGIRAPLNLFFYTQFVQTNPSLRVCVCVCRKRR